MVLRFMKTPRTAPSKPHMLLRLPPHFADGKTEAQRGDPGQPHMRYAEATCEQSLPRRCSGTKQDSRPRKPAAGRGWRAQEGLPG